MSRPTCPFEADVLLLGDGELPFERAVVVESHLAVCADCRRTEEALYAVETVLARPDRTIGGACEGVLRHLPRPVTPTPASAWWVAACALAALAWFVPPPGAVGPTGTSEVAAVDGTTSPDENDAFAIPPPSARRAVDVRALLAAGEDLDRIAARVARGGLPASRDLAASLRSTKGGELAELLAVARRVPEGVVLQTVEALADGEPMAWEVLADLALPGTEPALARGLMDERMRRALSALEQIGSAPAIEAVEARARVCGSEQFPELIVTLRRMDADVALQVLLEQDQDPEWRPVVLGVVANAPDVWVPALRTSVRRGGVLPARASCDVLAAHGDETVVDDLVRAAGRRGLREAAVGALVQLGGEPAWRAAARMASRRPELETHFDGCAKAASALAAGIDGWPDVPLDTLVRLLGRVGGDDALAALERLIDAGEQSPDLARALARIDSRAATTRLVALLDHARLGKAALESVRRLPAERVVPVLLERYESSGRRSRVHDALVDIAGVDLGGDAALWTDWWDRQT